MAGTRPERNDDLPDLDLDHHQPIQGDGAQCDNLAPRSLPRSSIACSRSRPRLSWLLLGTIHLIPGEARGQKTGPKPTMGFPAELCTRRGRGLQPQTKSRAADAMEPGTQRSRSLPGRRRPSPASAGPDPPRPNAFTPPLTQTCLLESISVGSQNNHTWSRLQHGPELTGHRPMSPLDAFWQPRSTDVDCRLKMQPPYPILPSSNPHAAWVLGPLDDPLTTGLEQ